MVVVFIVNTLFAANAQVMIEDNTNKIDSVLLGKLDDMKSSDSIAVSVWFTDIDRNVLRYNVEQAALNTRSLKSSTQVTSEAIELLFYDVDNADSINEESMSMLSERYYDITTEEMQTAIELERAVAAAMYSEHNQNILSTVLHSAIELDESENPVKLDYVCKYAPNVDMKLTKTQILNIIQHDCIEKINYRSTNDTAYLYNEETDLQEIVKRESSANIYDTSYYTATGLDTARDVFGLNGEGMHVGMIEDGGLVSTALLGKSVDNISINNRYSTTTHATKVAQIMVGEYTDENGNEIFTGAVPMATLHATCTGGDVSKLKVAAEALIDAGATIITASCGYYEDGISTSYYSDAAQWYDYISINRNVHFSLCSGNRQSSKPLQTPHSNNAYNAVVVGNCDNNGQICEVEGQVDSLYNTESNAAYKPDIVAPGTNIVIPKTENIGGTGTSFSTPMVASAMAQLSQASPVLQTCPTLMKAVLLSSSRITDPMSEEPMLSLSNSSNIACSRPYGAGMLSVTNAYTAFVTKGNYVKSSFSPPSGVIIHKKNITKSIGKTVRICAAWEKALTIGSDSDVYSSPLDIMTLQVVTPSGATYTSSFAYDNKQIISFVSTENGEYTIKLIRGGTVSSGQITEYAIAWSVQ